MKESWFVSSFARGLDVIRVFGPGRRLMKLSDVAAEAGISRAAARRFLKTLESLGYVGVEGDGYFLTVRVLDLGYSFVSSMEFSELAYPYLAKLADRAQGSSSIGVLDKGEVVFVARAIVERRFRLLAGIGSRHPAYALALGRAILAHLPAAQLKQYLAKTRLEKITERTITSKSKLTKVLAMERERGWSGCDGESFIGNITIAVPIFDAQGCIRCSVNLNVPGETSTPDKIAADHLTELKQTARHLEKALQTHLMTVTV